MMPVRLLETALLLGAYVLLAGLYGISYGIAQLKHSRSLHFAVIGFYGLHCAVAVAIVAGTPLDPGWKALLVASSAAILAIPPLTWRYLKRTHAEEIS